MLIYAAATGFVIAVIIWIIQRIFTGKKKPFIELRSSNDQRDFDPVKTVYNPKQYRAERKRR